jgi:hypothetical protein
MYKGMRSGFEFGEQNVNVTDELEAAELKTEVAELKVGVAVSAVAVVLVITASAFSQRRRRRHESHYS